MSKRILFTICTLFFALAATANAYQEPAAKPSGQPVPLTKLKNGIQSPAAPADSGNFAASPGFGSNVKSGDTITYTWTTKNGACYDSTPVITLEASGTTLVSASVVTQNSANDWNVSFGTPGDRGLVSFTTPTYLLKNETVTVNMVVRVNSGLPDGTLIQFKGTYKSDNGSDDSTLCAFSSGFTLTGSGYHIVKVEQPPDTLHHELIPPIYEGVKATLSGINDLRSDVSSVNNNVNVVSGNLVTVNNNLIAVHSNLQTRFDGVDGGINGVSNLVIDRFNGLSADLAGVNNNINTRFNSLQNTANTINTITVQTLDAVNNIRGTTASMVSQLNVLQTSANTANARLDVVNNKADSTLNKLDAATTKVDALQSTANVLNAKLDEVLSRLATAQQDALQFQIESALVQGDRYNMASLQLPRSLGGHLEEVRDLVDQVLQACRKAGMPSSVIAQATQELQIGDESMNAKNYKDAYEHFRTAYLHLSIVPGNQRP